MQTNRKCAPEQEKQASWPQHWAIVQEHSRRHVAPQIGLDEERLP